MIFQAIRLDNNEAFVW